MRQLIALTGLMSLAGCATQPMASRHALCDVPAHFGVVELPPSVDDRTLRRVLHRKHENVTENELARDRDHINQMLDAALQHSALAFAPASVRPEPSDYQLHLRVTDYGETPRRWKGAYVAFEVVTTVGIAGALTLHKTTRAAAGAYLLEESVEELSEGYAGFWTLNRLSRPVRLEADLSEPDTGKVLWHTARTGLARWRWRNLWHMNDTTRDDLLSASMHKAVKVVTDDLTRQCRRGVAASPVPAYFGTVPKPPKPPSPAPST